MSNDVKIKQFRETIDAKRKALGDKPRLAYATNALLDLDGDRINLNTLSNEAACANLVARLLTADQSIANANEVLGTSVVLTLGGFSAAQWIEDIKLRLKLIVWERKKKQLVAMDGQLRALRSDDAKTADAIADIAAQLES